MELRFITFNSIIHKNLMPWLTENQDEEKFRLLLRKINHKDAAVFAPFFIALPDAFNQIGIDTGPRLRDEWTSFSQILTPVGLQVIQPFLNLGDTDPKLVFYTSLIANTTAASVSHTVNLMAENKTDTLRKHRITDLMKAISDLIFSARNFNPGNNTDRVIMSRLLAGLAIVYNEIMMRFPDSVEPSVLKISKTDIRNIVQTTSHKDKVTRLLFHTISDRYYPITIKQQAFPVVAAPEQDQNHSIPGFASTNLYPDADLDMLREMANLQEEISGIKAAVIVALKKKVSLPQEPDSRIGSAEVCRLLHISKSTLKTYREKKLFSSNKIGSRYNYSLNEINELLTLRK